MWKTLKKNYLLPVFTEFTVCTQSYGAVGNVLVRLLGGEGVTDLRSPETLWNEQGKEQKSNKRISHSKILQKEPVWGYKNKFDLGVTLL